MKHDDDDVLAAAFEGLAGAALVLDAQRRVRLATPEAVKLLGRNPPRGALATEVLCGGGPKRPLADALAAGQAVRAIIPLPGGPEGRLLHVRAIPHPVRSPRAFVLLFELAGPTASAGPVLFHGMWTQDARMKEVFRVIERVAADDDTVLVRGETGSGKELVAGAIHALSARRKGPLRAINCAALPSNLLESELFGHVRGSFTGAHRDAPGHIQLAHKGTLFLDEVAELPLDVQAKLLRFLETRTVIPIGGRDALPVDVRVVSATHRALRKEVEAGRFRADLLYRLRVIPIFLPPLRDRPDDLALLTDKLLLDMNPGRRRQIERVAPAALEILAQHSWPGNVRELRNVLAYAYATGDGPVLLPSDLPPELLSPETAALPAPPDETGAVSGTSETSEESARVREALRKASGNRELAAAALGISRVTLWRRMRELGLLRRR
ncbi:MAG TPA: sigma 54-interacting transcriptional regulator [Labilithrix sp.]|nr:sigma 54-interacting transcriptional regulator [Labilithrix sp.]